MRWFVEVSRVGENSSFEKYCVEAKQWQAALQEARRLRGDSGPLSKFSIELLDDGYRAVDAKQKLRFVVAKAPPEAELSSESAARPAGVPSNGQAASVPVPAAQGSGAAPLGRRTSAAPVAAAAPSGPPRNDSLAGVPSSALSPVAAAKATHGITVPADAIPAAPPIPQSLGPAVPPPQSKTQPSASLDLPPPSTVLRRRQEEPTVESPITYREVAYVVEPGVSRASVEALLWASFRDVSRELADQPGQKFVQLAVFDHAFDKRPLRAPLGTLAWKDWRGNPVITFPLFDGTSPARVSVPAPSIKPSPVVRVSSSPPPSAGPVAAPPTAIALAPVEPVSAVQPEPSAAIPLTREKTPSTPSARRSSRPRLASVRRRAGEDLIGELFDSMHDLHFMPSLVDGAEFVLAAIDSILPGEGVLIHVFDINTHQFAVVRAKGVEATRVLLHRTPDSEPFFNAVMRRHGSIVIPDVQQDPRILGPRWDALGVKPQRALCGPVQQSGRYLGLIEIVNPLGEAPFHETEQNAIDYISGQFAEFLANRPIVLDAEVILKR